jgi:hypothetical protein
MALWVAVARAGVGVRVAVATGALAAAVVVATRLWNRARGPATWADAARLVFPVAVAAPLACLVSFVLG